MLPKSIMSEVPVIKWFNGVNTGGYTNMNNITKAINEIKKLLEEADAHAEYAADGYDAGWYNGEGNAYETVLKILERTLEVN